MSEDIDVGQIGESLNDKADRDLNNTQPLADYVVESQFPTAENNYSWYRKYKSGWVEQGGVIFMPSASWYTISLPVEMADRNYQAHGTQCQQATTDYFSNAVVIATRTSTTEVQLSCYSSANVNVVWEVKGMSAQGA